jgi:hypothetical protein
MGRRREKPGLALRATAVKLSPQLLDLELEMDDQRFVAGPIRLSAGHLIVGQAPITSQAPPRKQLARR